MKKIILSFFLLISLHLEATTENSFQKIRPLVFQVKTSAHANLDKNSYGSAFVIDKEGLLITNYHVVASAIWKPDNNKIFVSIEDHNKEAQIVEVDFINDLALIKVDHRFKGQIQIANNFPRQGEEVLTYGLPEDIDWSVVKGIYNGSVRQGPFERIHLSTPLNSGMSGGPTLNQQNQLIAVNSLKYSYSQQISFGIPFPKVKTLLNKYKSKSRKGEDGHLKTLQSQLMTLQDQMTSQILKSLESKREISGILLPNFSNVSKCWSRSNQNRRKYKFNYEGEACDIELSVPLVDDKYVGSFSSDFIVYSNEGLNPFAWQSILINNWDDPLSIYSNVFDKDAIINFSQLKCIRNRVSTISSPMTIAICTQKLLPLDQLHDVYILTMKPLKQSKAVLGQLKLSGFTQKNIKKITETILNFQYEGAK